MPQNASLVPLISEPIRVNVISYVIYKRGNSQYPEQVCRNEKIKGKKSIFSAMIRLTKIKFTTLVTSNTDQSHGLGAIGIVKYNELGGISLSRVLLSNFFAARCGEFCFQRYGQ